MKGLSELKNEFYEVMYKYEKSFSEEGVMANLTAWQTAKADLLSLLRRHPNWNEDEQAIIFDCNQALSIQPDMVDETAFTLLDIASEILSVEQLEDFRTALHAAVSGYSCTVSEENLEILRQRGGIRCAKDQKASRIIGKLCKKYGVDRHTRYNAVFAQLADALNPLTMQEIGVLSVHPCDFLEMSSKSNTWVSCHRLSDGGYQAGCLSYMNDSVSMVFYAVDADVSGEYRKAIRRYRQMFFYKDGTLYQSRLYPADTGNALEVSKLFRHLVQQAISRCLTEPNLWYLKTKRHDLNAHLSTYRGSLHYPDYNYHGNLSVLQGHRKDTELTIGAAAKCVCCGNELRSNGAIKCSCKEVAVCRKCGQTVARGQGIYLEDGFYCKTCLHICAACGRPTLGTMYPAYNRRGTLVEVCQDCYQQLTSGCAFYHCDNPDFTEFVCSFGFKENSGSFSDISVVAPHLKTAAVNISAGYFNEHRPHEMIDTYAMCENVRRLTAMFWQNTCHFPYKERVHARGSMFGEQSSLFAPMVERPSRAVTCKLLMPLPEETRLYMGQHQIGSAPEYRMDRSGNLYMYLERLNAAVEADGVFACDAGGHPPVFSAVCEGTRFLPVYTYEEAVERLENA